MKKTQRHEKIIEHFIDEVPPPTNGPGSTVTSLTWDSAVGGSAVGGVAVGGVLGSRVQGSTLTCLAVEHAGRPSFKRYKRTKSILPQ